MKVLVISDIHGNLTALETVVEHAEAFDAVWCLGDVVGYGPDPNECVEYLQTLPNLVCLLGNHDAAAIDKIDVSTFNKEARISISWMKRRMTKENLAVLQSLPSRLQIGDVTLAHASPRQPIVEYILDSYTATENFQAFDTPYCFVGHTHLPVHYVIRHASRFARPIVPEPNTAKELHVRSINNPGSVGQPRDRDNRASYVIYDIESKVWDYRRVEYDFISVQRRMEAQDLPTRHIDRLAGGW
jgi:predicted phosphodiesterase